MCKPLASGAHYANRPAGVVVVNLSLDKEAALLLRELAPTSKSHGRLVSQLIYAHAERRALRTRVNSLLAMEGPTGVEE